MSFALGRMLWPPEAVWAATLPELEWAAACFAPASRDQGPPRNTLCDLIDRFPDHQGEKNAFE